MGLEKHYILSGNTPDALRERVPQITRGIGERAISSLPRSTSRREIWYFTYASTSALCFKVQPVCTRDIWDQVLFYFCLIFVLFSFNFVLFLFYFRFIMVLFSLYFCF